MDHTHIIGLGAAIVIITMIALMSARKRRQYEYECSTSHGRDVLANEDDIICVKKVTPEGRSVVHRNTEEFEVASVAETPTQTQSSHHETSEANKTNTVVVYHLLSPRDKPYIGYELLQALQSAGLHYGEMQIFHRHEHERGLGKVLFSVAMAHEPGIFDMEKMGAIVCQGLTFFMQTSDDAADETNLELLLQTMLELRDDLGGTLIDSNRQPLIFE